jgi:hypothetical protein
MSTNGDHEMADVSVGADVNNAEVELVEPQRIRVVSLLSIFSFLCTKVSFFGPKATCCYDELQTDVQEQI